MFLAFLVCIIVSIVSFRLGYIYGIYDGTRLTVRDIQMLLTPQDFDDLHLKLKDAAKSKQLSK